MIPNNGFYGEFGGVFVPDVLRANLVLLEEAYRKYAHTAQFQSELDNLLATYVGRPSPLYHSKKLSERYHAKIYLKREDLNHTGAHKINNTLGQILLARYMGRRRIVAETGAGSHGVAVATVCALLDMECVVYMGAIDVERQRANVERMELLGATVIAASSGSKILSDAVNEALAHWCRSPHDTFYLLGSAVGPAPYPEMVAHFQSIISREIASQLLAVEGRGYPDVVVACIGGGSNALGAFFDFIENDSVRLVVAEAGGEGIDSGRTAASLNLGRPYELHGSRSLVLLDDDGQPKEPYSVSAGLDYPGVGPLVAHLYNKGRIEAIAITDNEAIAAARDLSRTEGIIPALETAHALSALAHLYLRPTDIVVVNLSGRGDKDISLIKG